jgi:hypothetical protein
MDLSRPVRLLCSRAARPPAAAGGAGTRRGQYKVGLEGLKGVKVGVGPGGDGGDGGDGGKAALREIQREELGAAVSKGLQRVRGGGGGRTGSLDASGTHRYHASQFSNGSLPALQRLSNGSRTALACRCGSPAATSRTSRCAGCTPCSSPTAL